jgi:hypothetical protein
MFLNTPLPMWLTRRYWTFSPAKPLPETAFPGLHSFEAFYGDSTEAYHTRLIARNSTLPVNPRHLVELDRQK